MPRRQQGLTLVELLVIVAIVGILATLSFWSLQSTLDRWRVTTAARDVADALTLARARAIGENRTYFVRFNATEYDVLWDANANGLPDDAVVVSRPYGRNVQYLQTSAPLTPLDDSGSLAYTVMFRPNGLASNASPAGSHMAVTDGPNTRVIRIRYSGVVNRV